MFFRALDITFNGWRCKRADNLAHWAFLQSEIVRCLSLKFGYSCMAGRAETFLTISIEKYSRPTGEAMRA